MTPTPAVGMATPSMTQFWVIVGVAGVVLALLVIGLATGVVSLKPRKVRRSVAGGMSALDAALSGAGRKAAIEYVLTDQDEVVEEQEEGQGNGNEGQEGGD